MSVIVVVGSLHYDIMVDAPHRPAAGETVTGRRWYPKFGGKGGNQALAIAAQGGAVRMVSAVGDDAFAAFLLARLEDAGIDTARIARLSDTGSGMSVAITDDTGDYGAVIVSGANLAIDADALADPALWEGAGWVVLQNEVREAVNLAAARAARANGVKVCLNAAPARVLQPELVPLLDLLIVNAVEAEAFSGIAVDSLDAAVKAADRMSREVACVVVTAGGDGVALAKGDTRVALEAEPVRVVSTHGAGDCFTGALIARLAEGAEPDAALRHANAEAARHVSAPRSGDG